MMNSPRAHVAAIALGVVALWACGGESGDEGADGASKAGPQDQRVTAAALDFPVAKSVPEGYVTSQVYWRRLLEAASGIETAALADGVGVDEPGALGIVRAAMDTAVKKNSGVPAESLSEYLTIREIDLGPVSPRSRLMTLHVSAGGANLRSYLLHALSPAYSVTGAQLLTEERALKAPPEEQVGVMIDRAVTREQVDDLAGAGVDFVFCVPPDDDYYTNQYSFPVALDPMKGLLPIPVIYFPAANTRHVGNVARNPLTTIDLKIAPAETASPPANARMLVTTIKGRDSSRKIVATAGRLRAAASSSEVGSRSLAAAMLVEITRVLLAAGHAKSAYRLECDVEIVHVFDQSRGFEFIRRLKVPGQTILGVVDVQAATLHKDAKSYALALGLEASAPRSAFETALVDVGREYARKAGSWASIGVHGGGAPSLATLASSCNQERIPIAVLPAFGTGLTTPHAAYPEVRQDSAGLSPGHLFVTSANDRINQIEDPKAQGSVVVARLVATAILRLGKATP